METRTPPVWGYGIKKMRKREEIEEERDKLMNEGYTNFAVWWIGKLILEVVLDCREYLETMWARENSKERQSNR